MKKSDGLVQSLKQYIDEKLGTVNLYTITFWEAICYIIAHWQPSVKRFLVILTNKSLDIVFEIGLIIVLAIGGHFLYKYNQMLTIRILYFVLNYYFLVMPFLFFNLDEIASMNKSALMSMFLILLLIAGVIIGNKTLDNDTHSR